MTLGLGIVGLGTAGAVMASAARRRQDVRLVALADTRIAELDLPQLTGCRQYPSLDALLEDEAVDAVHLSTPTQLHLEHVMQALAAGRDVIVEKPVTVDSESGERLIAAARRHDRVVIVGHSESFEPHVRAAAEAIAGGAIGQPVMIVAEKFTDWMRRPRLPEEWDAARGGGLIRRQGVHQFDVVRTLVRADYDVRSVCTRPDPERGSPGSYSVWLDGSGLSDGGAAPDAFVMHDGVGRVSGGSLQSHADEQSEKRARSRAQLELALRGAAPLTIGGGDAERILVMGSEGDLIASGGELELHDRQGRRAIPLSTYASGRDAVLDELVAAVVGDRPVVHDLAWGTESLRLCEAVERVADGVATASRL